MSVAQAEPFHVEGGPVGVLLLHGFTGSPVSMRPWAEHLAKQGWAVNVPLLPGHSTGWQQLNKTRWHDWYAEASRAFDLLRVRCEHVVVAGLSMGGTLALRLAEQRAETVAGLVLVNPSVSSTHKRLIAVPLLKHLVGSLAGIGNDIKMPGVDEHCYERVPLKALDSLRSAWKVTCNDLPKITSPLLLFRSVEDHVVEPLSAQLITQRVSSRDVSERLLADSYHVATLDNDAASIFSLSARFIARTCDRRLLRTDRHAV
ncbi:MAG: alpha/beta hydrolase [Nocardioidaceae bacterium]